MCKEQKQNVVRSVFLNVSVHTFVLVLHARLGILRSDGFDRYAWFASISGEFAVDHLQLHVYRRFGSFPATGG